MCKIASMHFQQGKCLLQISSNIAYMSAEDQGHCSQIASNSDPGPASICRGAAAVCRVTTILICPHLNCRILHQLPHLAEGLHVEERGLALRAALPEDGRVGPRQPAHHQPHLRRREVPIHDCQIIVAISPIHRFLFAGFCLPAGAPNPLSKCLSVFSFNFVGCHFDFSKIRILESFSLHFPTLNQCWEC